MSIDRTLVLDDHAECKSIRLKTTPTHTFTLPFETDILDLVEITYKQGNVIRLVKKSTDDSVTMDGKDVVVELTQEETLLFLPELPVFIQVCVLSKQGDALTSNVIKAPVSGVLNPDILEV